MKFYVISIILTVAMLFIPIIQPAIADTGENTIAVSLESFEEPKGNETDSSNEVESSGGGGGSGGSPQTKEEQRNPKQEKTENNVQTKETRNEVSDNKNKTVSTGETSNVSSKTAEPGTNTGPGNDNPGTDKGKGKGSGDGDGNGGKPGGGSPGNGPGSGPGKAPAAYGCVKGKGYKMVTNPKIKLNKAQGLQVPSGTKVSVTGSFNAGGSLTITGVSGGNAEAQKLARNAASGVRVNVIDKTITKCSVTITYTLYE
jgi:hypothetical protein